MKRRHMIAALAATALPRAARADAESDWAETITKARQEATVTIYHNFLPTGALDVVRAFNRRFPEIKVDDVRLPSAQYYQRFAAESQSGKVTADVGICAMDDALLDWAKQGWLAQWQPPEGDAIPSTLWWEDRIWGVQVIREIFVYNSRLIQREAAPFEWADLFDAKWKGKIGLDEPWRSIGSLQCMKMLETSLRIDPAAKFKEQDVRFFAGSANVLDAVVKGEIAIGQLSDLALPDALSNGAPVRAVYPVSGVTFMSNVVSVSQDAPHPNAGRVFANWLMSVEGQTAVQDFCGSPGVRTDLPAHKYLPPNGRINAIDGRKVLSHADADRLSADWRRVFGAG